MFRCRACSAAFSQNADLVLHNRNVQCTFLTPHVSTNVITSTSVNDQSSLVQETLLIKPAESSDRAQMMLLMKTISIKEEFPHPFNP
jgi:hypothetical protein